MVLSCALKGDREPKMGGEKYKERTGRVEVYGVSFDVSVGGQWMLSR